MNRSGNKCVLYPRVSTEMQVDGFSLGGQKNNYLSRFGQNAADILNSLEHIQSFGVNLICIGEWKYGIL